MEVNWGVSRFITLRYIHDFMQSVEQTKIVKILVYQLFPPLHKSMYK